MTSTCRKPRSKKAFVAQKTNKKKATHPKKKSGGKGFFVRLLTSWKTWTVIILFLLLSLTVFYCIFVGPHSFRWRASHGETKYPTGFDIHGIDISRYQKEIDWELLRNAQLDTFPIQFVFIKATEGENMTDKYFKKNFSKAKENHLIRGAYHFFVPGVDATKQAKSFIRQVKLETGDLPPVLDIEKSGKLSKYQIQKEVKTWLDIVERHYGVKPIIYTGYKFKTRYLNTDLFNDYPHWIAHYNVSKMRYKGKWAFWQHTDYGKANGIIGPVDCNVFNGSYEELMSLTLQDCIKTDKNK